MTQRDLTFLRRCVDLAEQAVEAGDEPFGSILVDRAGIVRFEDHNHVAGGDHTRHPEFAIARWAARYLTPTDRAAATVYTSGEHCPMCAAAHGWVGLGRIVYASSTRQLQQWRTELGAAPGPVAALSIETVVPGAVVDGPAPQFADRLREMHARSLRAQTADAGLPPIEVSPTHGKLLALLCRIAKAKRVLEFGTLGGHSTFWFAEAVGANGHVTTLENEPAHADVAAANTERAGLTERVRIMVGPAAQSVRGIIDAGEEAYDLVFIDAEKPNNRTYLAAALELSRPGTVIVCDNVGHGGGVVDENSEDASVRGARALVEAMGADRRLTATAIQTVDLKGWDGFAIAVVEAS